MLASVMSPAEAEAVFAGGADIIDLKDPARGALGALDIGVGAALSEAILLNTRGSIAGASVANGFAVREGRLETLGRRLARHHASTRAIARKKSGIGRSRTLA
ncbi:MAG TPA: (5-formylfuran-3-yl)methyl phosphate synthase [Methylocella sp.]|nr:(5-formylfuran-3-yl)methyl phosphate synthase [Methylocella sp.]